MLCGAVDAAVGKDHPRRHRSDLNDEPAAFNQVGKADVQGGQHAFDVDIDHGVPIGEVRLVHGGEDTQPGIGNGHVEPPKCCDTARHGFLLGCRVQDIQSVRHHAAFTLGACRGFFRHGLQHIHPAGRGPHAVTAGDQQARNGRTDTTAGAGEKNGLGWERRFHGSENTGSPPELNR